MKLMTTNGRRAVAALLLTAFVTAMVAPAAEAGNRHKRHKGGHSRSSRVVVHSYPQRVIVRDHGVAPVIAFLGGLVIGASVAHASHPDEYAYYDPYCDTRYASLEIYTSHARRHHHHPRIVRVIHVSSGRCVDSYRYHDGHWYSRDRWDDRWDDGRGWDDGDRYDQERGWDDDRWDD
jgi:hypothetical protein